MKIANVPSLRLLKNSESECIPVMTSLAHNSIHAGAYILDYEDRFGTSNRSAVIGEVYCNGTEPELLECFHASIGTHPCYRGSIDSDIIISCYGTHSVKLRKKTL